MKRWRKRESWLPRRRSSGPTWLRSAVACLALVSAMRFVTPAHAVTLGWPSDVESVAVTLEELQARALVIVTPGVSWSQVRAARLPNLQRLLDSGASALMPAGPVRLPSDADTRGCLGLARIVARGDQPALRRDLRRALDQSQMVVVEFSKGSAPRDLLASADALIGDALADLRGREVLVALVAPSHAKPFDRAPHLGFTVLWEAGDRDNIPTEQLRFDPKRYADSPSRYLHWMLTLTTPGALRSPSTRWSGIIPPADISPTLLAWWGLGAAARDSLVTGRVATVEQERGVGRRRRLDHLDAVLTDRYRVRILMAKLYAGYGALVALAGIMLAFWWRQQRFLGALALGVVFVPVGLAVAAPVPPGHDALYLALSFAIAVVLGSVATAAGRRGPAYGLALAMLLGAALILADVLSGSPLMRFSALEMGIMMSSRFYGIGNEYMGALVGMTVIGLGAMMHVAPTRGRLAALIGAFVTLVIGLACWGANWGGSFVAAFGLMTLWLATRRRVGARHIVTAAGALLLSIVVPGVVDLLNAPESRSHIGASAAALLGGDTAGLADMIARKAAIAVNVVRVAPWSVLAGALCALVLWLQLRRGAPARRALEGRRALAAGIAAAIAAGVIAMITEDSGPAAGMGALLAALGTLVFLASRAPETPA